jgi:hypothetical protein
MIKLWTSQALPPDADACSCSPSPNGPCARPGAGLPGHALVSLTLQKVATAVHVDRMCVLEVVANAPGPVVRNSFSRPMSAEDATRTLRLGAFRHGGGMNP